jgi:vitamin B12 transport system substrate-binding protein
MHKPLALISLIVFSVALSPAMATMNTKPRIVALSPHIVEMLYAIGAGEQIVATVDSADYPLAAKAIPRIGNYLRLQLERIIELKPDLIIAWRSGSPSDDLQRLQQLGFKIIYSDPKTFTDIALELKTLGKLTAHRQLANKLANNFLKQLFAIKQRYANKNKIVAFYQLWPAPLTTIAKQSWPQQHLDICKVENPFFNAPTAYPTVGIEQIIIHPLQAIIIPTNASATKQKIAANNWQKWSHLPAVKHQQFIFPDTDKIHRMTPRALVGLTEFCQQVDMVRDFYDQLRY